MISINSFFLRLSLHETIIWLYFPDNYKLFSKCKYIDHIIICYACARKMETFNSQLECPLFICAMCETEHGKINLWGFEHNKSHDSSVIAMQYFFELSPALECSLFNLCHPALLALPFICVIVFLTAFPLTVNRSLYATTPWLPENQIYVSNSLSPLMPTWFPYRCSNVVSTTNSNFTCVR